MAIQIIASHIEDTGASSSTVQKNYGPLNLVQGVKVTKFELSGSLAFDGSGTWVDNSASWFGQAYGVGIQYGATGYTPYNVFSAGGLELLTSIVGERPPPAASIASWAPNTDTAAVVDRWPFRYVKYRQLVVPTGGLDFYASAGPFYSSSQGFRTFATLRIWYVN